MAPVRVCCRSLIREITLPRSGVPPAAGLKTFVHVQGLQLLQESAIHSSACGDPSTIVEDLARRRFFLPAEPLILQVPPDVQTRAPRRVGVDVPDLTVQRLPHECSWRERGE